MAYDVSFSSATISIHAPPRGATQRPCCARADESYFNSRPSARGDERARGAVQPAEHYFNSRPSARGDLRSWKPTRRSGRFQFTPLREGRHWAVRRIAELEAISIHAPPRGATKIVETDCMLPVISIHAPPRGATACPSDRRLPFADFNSRPSARGDSASQQCRASASFQFTPLREGRLNFYREAFDNLIISIHAPPRGATGRCHRVCPAGYFNSRPSARGDIYLAALQGVPREFQFTPLREGRHIGAPKWYNANRISIHAPPRGATGQLFSGKIRFLISIHAPPRGATHPRARRRRTGAYFNSRPSARGDVDGFAGSPVRLHFNSRPSARGDGHPRRAEAWTRQFQFTPLREGRRAEIISPAAPAPFQFTPLREGRRSRLTLTRFSIPFQFTPLREGRRKKTMNTYTFAPKFQFTPLREGRP